MGCGRGDGPEGVTIGPGLQGVVRLCHAGVVSTCQLVSDDATVVINAACGGRLSSLKVGGLELLTRCGPAPYEWGSFVMAPFAGRIRRGLLQWDGRTHRLPLNNPPHAMHGVVLDRTWDVVERSDSTMTLRCDFDERWPWKGHVEHRLELGTGRLEMSLAVYSQEAEMPAWAGWHPWFARTLAKGGTLRIGLDADGMLERDDEGLPSGRVVPVGRGPWDDCFTGVRWPVTLTWPGAVRLDISADTDHVVVFTKRPSGVCVEPQSAPPDAVALDRYSVVTPDEPLVRTMTWAWTV